MTSLVTLLIALAAMLIELRVSLRNERALRQRGALAPPDPAYAAMRWAYPVVFLLMGIEGMVFGSSGGTLLAAGVVVFAAAKALKVWAIHSLGERWTFRLFILPSAPLVTSGPYRWMRHPNYVAVIGELVGFALLSGARITGIVALLGFGTLLRQRVRAEEDALGLDR